MLASYVLPPRAGCDGRFANVLDGLKFHVLNKYFFTPLKALTLVNKIVQTIMLSFVNYVDSLVG